MAPLPFIAFADDPMPFHPGGLWYRFCRLFSSADTSSQWRPPASQLIPSSGDPKISLQFYKQTASSVSFTAGLDFSYVCLAVHLISALDSPIVHDEARNNALVEQMAQINYRFSGQMHCMFTNAQQSCSKLAYQINQYWQKIRWRSSALVLLVVMDKVDKLFVFAAGCEEPIAVKKTTQLCAVLLYIDRWLLTCEENDVEIARRVNRYHLGDVWQRRKNRLFVPIVFRDELDSTSRKRAAVPSGPLMILRAYYDPNRQLYSADEQVTQVGAKQVIQLNVLPFALLYRIFEFCGLKTPQPIRSGVNDATGNGLVRLANR